TPQTRLLPPRSVAPRADLRPPIAGGHEQGHPALQEAGRARSQQLVQAIWSWLNNRLFSCGAEGFCRNNQELFWSSGRIRSSRVDDLANVLVKDQIFHRADQIRRVILPTYRRNWIRLP